MKYSKFLSSDYFSNLFHLNPNVSKNMMDDKRYLLDDNKTTSQVAVFALGWFWKPQRKFDKLPGVLSTTVGYTGGDPSKRATYKTICSGDGNVEALAIVYDPRVIKYDDLLVRFMSLHDPTKRKKRQYCSAIFSCTAMQRTKAEEMCGKDENIQTKIETLHSWQDAEQRHQKYYEKKAAKKDAMRAFASKNNR